MARNILCIETATTICSVAIFADARLLGYQEYRIEKSHSSLLPGIIDSTLSASGITRSDLRAVAVSAGPGSYTGLRIGVSIAKGICFSLALPLISINTLHLMAAGVNRFNKKKALLCPMIDARRMEVYSAIFDWEGRMVDKVAPHIVDSSSYAGFLGGHEVWFFGDGAQKCKEVLEHHPNAMFLEGVYPSASFMGTEADAKFMAEDFEDLAYFEPFYLKEFRVTKPKKAL